MKIKEKNRKIDNMLNLLILKSLLKKNLCKNSLVEKSIIMIWQIISYDTLYDIVDKLNL